MPLFTRCLLLLALLAAGSRVGAAQDARHSSPLRAIVTLADTHVHVDTVFDVTLELQNQGDFSVHVKIPDLNWDRIWKTSNRHVTWDAFQDDDDSATDVEIAPHSTYTFSTPLKMFVDESYRQSQVTFRMGFKTGSFGKTLWSDPVTLQVSR